MVAASSLGGEEVVPPVALEDVCAFHVARSELLFPGAICRLQPGRVQLDRPYPRTGAEAAPEKVFLPVVVDEQRRVYRVRYPGRLEADDLSQVGEGAARTVRHSDAAAFAENLRPCSESVVQHVFPVHIVDVGRPDARVPHPFRASFRKSVPDELPIREVP